MEQRMNINKGKYIALCFGLIGLGVILMSICTYLYVMKIDTNYTFYYNLIAGMIIGSGIGLSYARMFKIEGYD